MFVFVKLDCENHTTIKFQLPQLYTPFFDEGRIVEQDYRSKGDELKQKNREALK